MPQGNGYKLLAALLQMAVHQPPVRATRVANQFFYWGIACALAISASGCAFAALWINISEANGPQIAALATSACLASLSGGLFAVNSYLSRTQERPVVDDGVVITEAVRLASEYKYALFAGMLVAAFIYGRKK